MFRSFSPVQFSSVWLVRINALHVKNPNLTGHRELLYLQWQEEQGDMRRMVWPLQNPVWGTELWSRHRSVWDYIKRWKQLGNLKSQKNCSKFSKNYLRNHLRRYRICALLNSKPGEELCTEQRASPFTFSVLKLFHNASYPWSPWMQMTLETPHVKQQKVFVALLRIINRFFYWHPQILDGECVMMCCLSTCATALMTFLYYHRYTVGQIKLGSPFTIKKLSM